MDDADPADAGTPYPPSNGGLIAGVGVDVVEVGEKFDQSTEWHLASATRQQCP